MPAASPSTISTMPLPTAQRAPRRLRCSRPAGVGAGAGRPGLDRRCGHRCSWSCRHGELSGVVPRPPRRIAEYAVGHAHPLEPLPGRVVGRLDVGMKVPCAGTKGGRDLVSGRGARHPELGIEVVDGLPNRHDTILRRENDLMTSWQQLRTGRARARRRAGGSVRRPQARAAGHAAAGWIAPDQRDRDLVPQR